MHEHLFPVFDRMVSREAKELKLKQHSKVIWFTGLSGSGKTTLALALEHVLFDKGFFTQVLDGDNIRTGINNNLGFSPDDRMENIRRIAEIAKLYLHSGVICLCAFVSPTNEIRQVVRSVVGEEDFVEIFVSTPLEVCEIRDIKGLYRKARSGQITEFTGISAPFDVPENARMVIDTSNRTVEECVQEIYCKLIAELQWIE